MNESVSIKFYEPTSPQIRALETLYKQKPFITILNYGRQTGKSFMALMEAMTMCINKYNWNGSLQYRVMFITPSNNLADKHIATIDAMFSSRPEAAEMIIKKGGVKLKSKEVHFKNGSVLMFRSAEMGDALRGDTVNFLIVDEAAFIEQNFINTVCLPMLTRTKGRSLMVSTPNGRNWFYRRFLFGSKPENSKAVISLRADYRELKDPDVEIVIDALREELTKAQFAAEVMGEFITADSLFTDIESKIFSDGYEPDETLDRFIGIDVGVVNDFTVLTCMNSAGDIIDIDRFNVKEDDLSYIEYKDRIINFVSKHNEKLVCGYFEINNKDLLFEDLQSYEDSNGDAIMLKIESFNTNVASKPKMINALIKAFDDGLVGIPDNDNLIAELYAYTSKTNPITGKVQFQGDGESHDDMVSSLALANFARIEWADGGETTFN